jgi:hypothetical protein
MNRKHWAGFFVATMVIALLGVLSPLGAQLQMPSGGNIKIGPVAVHPFVGLTETYNDNIYRNYGNFKSEADFITSLSPGIQFFLPVQRHSFQLDYQADLNWFASNSNTNFANQRVGGAMKLDFPGGLLINLSDYFSDAKIPRKAKNGDNSANDPYRDLPYTQNIFDAKAKYQFVDRWAVEGRYTNFNYAYKNSYDDSGSLKRDIFGGSVYYRFTPKVDALVDYNYGKTTYKTSSTNDNKEQSVYAGLSFDPTAKLRGYLKLGWAKKDYEQDVPNRNNTINTFAALGDLNYLLSRYDSLTLKLNRSIREDIDTNAPYTFTDASLWYSHILAWNEKISLNANLGYGTSKFEASTVDIDGTIKTRDDKRYYGGVGVAYALQRWLNLGLNYSYTNNDSNMLNYNYKENKVWFSAIAAF